MLEPKKVGLQQPEELNVDSTIEQIFFFFLEQVSLSSNKREKARKKKIGKNFWLKKEKEKDEKKNFQQKISKKDLSHFLHVRLSSTLELSLIKWKFFFEK